MASPRIRTVEFASSVCKRAAGWYCIGLMAFLASSGAHAHGGHPGGHAFGASGNPDAVSFGRPGDPAKVSRIVSVTLNDRECLLEPVVRVRQGDTVRFSVRNQGTRMHELVIGTSHELKAHAGEAGDESAPGHDRPYVLHVESGAEGNLVWRFTRVDLLGYGCLLHGTERTEMTGRIIVER